MRTKKQKLDNVPPQTDEETSIPHIPVQELRPEPQNITPIVLPKSAISRAKQWSQNYFSHNLSTTAVAALTIAFIGASSFAIYEHIELTKAKNQLSEIKSQLSKASSPTPADNNTNLIETVGKFITLPSGEQPTIATVTDVSKLQNQPFFKNASEGDKVLIFKEAKKAILWRPSTSKVIEYAPLQTDESQEEGNVAGSSTEKKKPTKSTE